MVCTVYCLETAGFIWYVGVTRRPKERERHHRERQDKGMGADLIPEGYDWSFKVLETCDDNQRSIRERYWYNRLNPILNKQVPNDKTLEEYRQDWLNSHKEQCRQRHTEYMRGYRERKRQERANPASL